MERVVIGVDPHKLSATIEVVDDRERKLGSGRFTTDRAGSGHRAPRDQTGRQRTSCPGRAERAGTRQRFSEVAMVTARVTVSGVRQPWPTWLLPGSGLLLVLSGGIFWAWDADPGWGQALILLGLVVVVGGVLIRKRRSSRPGWLALGLGVLVTAFGCYEIWHAIVTILSQTAAHTA
ncbi:hypothetical protein BJ986_003148 [Phycicoccus badiiscoriae]|uniref:Uncharacterized protein n=1 Tax=Pedococcus badiiscoriae TaxID=642776 RepID=A0A852WM50_9MICO|nr:hypothetical protein [Pedococcus badiiscoriae]NYG08661.1 hypothetical protein [Pedococcus badiiscoriae]